MSQTRIVCDHQQHTQLTGFVGTMHVLSVFYQFFLLGCASFGGPVAHLGYFQRHFVENKKWLSAQRYAQFISLSQLLPGPGSSQVGFAIGLERAGLAGGIAAFIGFTLPSALIMTLLALSMTQSTWGMEGIIAGLKLFAVVIVLDALWMLAKQFCTNTHTRLLALLSFFLLVIFPSLYTQLLVLVCAALFGLLFFNNTQTTRTKAPWPAYAKWALGLFILLFVGSFFVTNPYAILAAQFYQAGALVFGGGHVVLPLLETILTDVDPSTFLSGYSAAQAIPGPMFTFASYLGAALGVHSPYVSAAIATLAIFLPGLLLMYAFYQHWQVLLGQPYIAAISKAINAAVVGFIASALYNPIIPAGISNYWQWAVVALAWWILRQYKPPILMMIASFIALGLLMAQF